MVSRIIVVDKGVKEFFPILYGIFGSVILTALTE